LKGVFYVKINLNLKQLLVISLGYNEFLHPEIDKLYEEKRWTYYEFFKSGKLYDDMTIKSFTAVKEEKMRKAAGIVEWCYKHKDFTLIHHLLKKGYKDVTRYYQQNRQRLNLEDFARFILKKKNKSILDMPELELAVYYIVLVYVAFRDKQKLEQLFNNDFAMLAFNMLNNIDEEPLHKEKIIQNLNQNADLKRDVIAFIKDATGVDINKRVPSALGSLLDYIIYLEHMQDVTKRREPFNTVAIEPSDEIHSSLFRTGIVNIIGGYSAGLKITELNHLDFLNIHLTKDELLLVGFNSFRRQEEKLSTPNEAIHHFIASLYIYASTKQYKVQKEALLEDTQETWYLDVQKREEETKIKEKKLKNQAAQIEKAYDEEKNKNKLLREQIKALEKELKRSRQEVEAFEGEKEELVELRNFAYSQPQIDIESNEEDVVEAADVLKTKKIILCGGRPAMHRRLKEWVPNLETVSTDSLNKNLNYLKGYDVIYFYPNYSSHAFYEKIKAAIKNSPTSFEYLPDIDNVGALLVQMHQHFKNVK